LVRHIYAFPTRRASDLELLAVGAHRDQGRAGGVVLTVVGVHGEFDAVAHRDPEVLADGDGLLARPDGLEVGHDVVLLCHGVRSKFVRYQGSVVMNGDCTLWGTPVSPCTR